jgi:HPt (histidine-containing phosphotransfer) domain-containing protein
MADTTRQVLDPDIVGRLERLGEAAGEDLMGSLARLFRADAARRIAALHEALARGDAPAVDRFAHILSGASANVGAVELASLCGSFAAAGAAGDLTHGGAELRAIEAELERVRFALDEIPATS